PRGCRSPRKPARWHVESGLLAPSQSMDLNQARDAREVHCQSIASPQFGGQFGIACSARIQVRCFLEVALEPGGRNELQHARRCVAGVPESMCDTAWLEDQSTRSGSQFSFTNLPPYLALDDIRNPVLVALGVQ